MTIPTTKARLLVSTVIVTILLAQTAPLHAELQVLLRTVTGKEHQGILMRCSTTDVRIEQPDGNLVIPASKLFSLSVLSDEPAVETDQTFVGLVDGSLIPVNKVTVEHRQVMIDSELLPANEQIPVSRIDWIGMRPLGDEARSYLQDVVAERRSEDIVIVQKGDPPQFDHLSGVIGDIGDSAVEFSWDDEQISVKRSKLAAVAFYHPRSESAPVPKCIVTTRNGAKLMVSALSYHPIASRNIEITLVGGIVLQIPYEQLVSADFSAGKVFYLSGLEPIRQQWTPLVGIPSSAELIQQHGLPRRDQSFAGSGISLAWPTREGRSQSEIRVYEKGLALRSRTTVEYRIPPGTRTFRTFAGIDPQTTDQGNVRLEILADKTKLWEGEINGHNPPEEISLTLRKARRLKIVVDYGKNLDYGDRLHLADARLIKE